MASKIVELLITAKDVTKGAFDSTIKRMSLLQKKASALRSIGSVVGSLFAGYGALQSFKAVIAATREQESALRQVEARLKSTGGASGETLDSLQKMASGLQDVTTYGDEAILKMQSLLLTFTNIKGDTFQAATESILDMSVSMGQDLKTSAVQLGKALNDPIAGLNSLSRVGVKFNDQQKEQIRTLTESGEIAKAQAIILKELQVEFGGAAVAAADTFGGAIEQLNGSFSDLLEAKGGGLISAKKEIQEFTEVLKDPKTKAAFEQATASFVKLSSSLAQGAAEGFNLFIAAGEKLGVTLAQGALKLQGYSNDVVYFDESLYDATETIKNATSESETLAETISRIGKEADKSRDLLVELGGVEYGNTDFSKGTSELLEKLEEERYLLKLSAKERFIYNNVKKAGEDATYEEINAIKKSAEALFEEKEQLKENRKQREQLTQSTKEYKDVKESVSSSGSASLFGKEKEEAEKLTEETEKATEAKRKWLIANSHGGKDTSDAFEPINLTPDQARVKAREIKTAMQDEFNNNPVQVKVQTPAKSDSVTSKSSFSDPIKGGGSGLSSLSISRDALKEGSKT